MRADIFFNSDINLYLTLEEFFHISIPELKIVDNKLHRNYKPLECSLQGRANCIILQHEDFNDLGDGIMVRCADGYFVSINDHASELLLERNVFGTRYGAGEKITIHVSE